MIMISSGSEESCSGLDEISQNIDSCYDNNHNNLTVQSNQTDQSDQISDSRESSLAFQESHELMYTCQVIFKI